MRYWRGFAIINMILTNEKTSKKEMRTFLMGIDPGYKKLYEYDFDSHETFLRW